MQTFNLEVTAEDISFLFAAMDAYKVGLYDHGVRGTDLHAIDGTRNKLLEQLRAQQIK